MFFEPGRIYFIFTTMWNISFPFWFQSRFYSKSFSCLFFIYIYFSKSILRSRGKFVKISGKTILICHKRKSLSTAVIWPKINQRQCFSAQIQPRADQVKRKISNIIFSVPPSWQKAAGGNLSPISRATCFTNWAEKRYQSF